MITCFSCYPALESAALLCRALPPLPTPTPHTNTNTTHPPTHLRIR